VLRTLIAIGLVAGLAACSDGVGPSDDATISLSFTTRAGEAAAAPGYSASVMADTLVDDTNTLVITKGEIVLREIELEHEDSDGCDSMMDDDGCEEFETGPILVDLPLNGSVETEVTIAPPAGTYDELEFEIHKVSEDDAVDAAFRADYPHMAGKSIRVEGTFNGEAFVYETDLDVEQEFDLVPPITVSDTTTAVNVTVLLDLNQWFRNGSGNLVNPETGNAGGINESLIKENIKRSVEAFEDDDHDGHDDDD
jgi:hypothetical protein